MSSKENINQNERSSASQCALILAHLKSGKTITSLSAREHPFDCLRLSGRIWDLRNLGYDIKTRDKVVGPNKKRIAEYYMEVK